MEQLSQLSEITAFVEVAGEGSFSKAARKLGTPKSTLSRKVSDLEARLGLKLMHRTTRQLHLTPAGARFWEACKAALSDIGRITDEVRAENQEPQGLIRMTAPLETSASKLPELIQKFMAQYPQIEMDLLFTDRIVDLVGEKVDLALRAGRPRDSSLKMRKLSNDEFQFFASPVYLKSHPKIQGIQDLKQHTLVLFSGRSSEQAWRVTDGSQVLRVPFKRRIQSSSILMARELARLGAGVTLLPTFLCQENQMSGDLIRILPSWSTEPSLFYLAWPPQKVLPKRLQLWMEFLSENFA